MPLDHTAARKLALLLYEEPLVKVTELKRIADGVYRIRSRWRPLKLSSELCTFRSSTTCEYVI